MHRTYTFIAEISMTEQGDHDIHKLYLFGDSNPIFSVAGELINTLPREAYQRCAQFIYANVQNTSVMIGNDELPLSVSSHIVSVITPDRAKWTREWQCMTYSYDEMLIGMLWWRQQWHSQHFIYTYITIIYFMWHIHDGNTIRQKQRLSGWTQVQWGVLTMLNVQ